VLQKRASGGISVVIFARRKLLEGGKSKLGEKRGPEMKRA